MERDISYVGQFEESMWESSPKNQQINKCETRKYRNLNVGGNEGKRKQGWAVNLEIKLKLRGSVAMEMGRGWNYGILKILSLHWGSGSEGETKDLFKKVPV